jgi:hypothetical protein
VARLLDGFAVEGRTRGCGSVVAEDTADTACGLQNTRSRGPNALPCPDLDRRDRIASDSKLDEPLRNCTLRSE